jgi:hypothetical protein
MTYYDRGGRPISQDEWMRLFAEEEHKRVARTEWPDGTVLSTVWLGLDHGFGTRPLIFETMVFPDEDCWRYSTESEAREAHAEIASALAYGHGDPSSSIY